jgi:hypothetical protein
MRRTQLPRISLEQTQSLAVAGGTEAVAWARTRSFFGFTSGTVSTTRLRIWYSLRQGKPHTKGVSIQDERISDAVRAAYQSTGEADKGRTQS